MSDPQPAEASWMPPPPAPPGAARRRPVLLAGTVALAVVAGAVAYVLAQGGGTSADARPLALSFAEGQAETYAIHQTMDGRISSELFGEMPLRMDLSQVTSWRVLSVGGDGVATIEVTTSDVSGTVNGMAVPATDVPPIEISVAPDGRILSAGGFALGGAEQTQGFGFPGMGQLTPILPDEGDEVAPGDTWGKEFSQEFPFGEGTIAFTASSVYERNERVDGRQAAVISTHLSIPLEFTLAFDEVLAAYGDELGPTGSGELGAFADAAITYDGSGVVEMTSHVDLDALELLRSQSAGDFEITMAFTGIGDLEAAAVFSGTFTQDFERR